MLRVVTVKSKKLVFGLTRRRGTIRNRIYKYTKNILQMNYKIRIIQYQIKFKEEFPLSMIFSLKDVNLILKKRKNHHSREFSIDIPEHVKIA